MKKILPLTLLLSAFMLLGCQSGNNPSGSNDSSKSDGSSHNSSSSEDIDPVTGDPKNYKGTGTIFEEYLGYNTKDASIFEDGNDRYVIYDGQASKEGEQVFAARKATKVNGKWEYGQKSIILRPTADGWDSMIANPSIVKGEFNYQGTKYSYLLAYNGNDNNENTNNHIGLAVSNDVLSGWVKVGDKPILKNPSNQEAAYGYGSPCLLSYDNKGKGYMFYATGEITVSFGGVRTYDFSNLDEPKLESGYTSLPVTGLNDGQDQNIILNAGFAFNSDKSKIYMVKDRLPQSTNRPNQSTAVEVAVADIDILTNHLESWTSLGFINAFNTMDMDDETSLGWDEIYSGDFVTDPFGVIESTEKLEILYSTYDEEGQNSRYSSTLAMFELDLTA